MKRYTIEVVVNEGNDEFWDELIDKKMTGCDDILAGIDSSIANGELTAGMDFTVRLTKYEDN